MINIKMFWGWFCKIAVRIQGNALDGMPHEGPFGKWACATKGDVNQHNAFTYINDCMVYFKFLQCCMLKL